MIGRLRDWLDHRTGYRKLVDALLLEHIPGGAKWRYVWGSTLAFVFSVQLITGLLLMTAYSAGDSTAWSSVYYIQYEMDFGWLIRGLHHFGSQTMVVLLGIHMLQVVIAGAQLPPREINWWLGLGLLATVLALSLTGYLLPWDQKGYWATQVATSIAGNLPGLGTYVQKVVVGGPVYGHHTLTRFFALHVGLLPPLVIVLTIAHLTVFRRHGVTVAARHVPVGEESQLIHSKEDGWFWPDQAFRDMVASMIIFSAMLTLLLWGHGHKLETTADTAASPGLYERWAHAGRLGYGANLDAPADPSQPYPARPEWYFLFLFQLLKYFEGEQELIGTVVIPNGVLVLLALLPLLGYGRMRKFGQTAGVVVVAALLVGVASLTGLALYDDRPPGQLSSDEIAQLTVSQRTNHEKRDLFHKELVAAERNAARAIDLASEGIPAEGAVYLLRRDPRSKGPEMFARSCGVCHHHQGLREPNAKPSASDLTDFGTAKWVRDLLREPDSPRFLGNTKLRGMSNWVKRARRNLTLEQAKELDAEFDLVADWLGSHPRGPAPGEADQSALAKGYRVYEKHCMECHTYNGAGGGGTPGPDFTGYGDADWLRLMIVSPHHPSRYGDRNRNAMPLFRDLEGPAAAINRQDVLQVRALLLKEVPDDDAEAATKRKAVEQATQLVDLSDIDRELILRWLLKDYRAVFGGEPITGPPKR